MATATKSAHTPGPWEAHDCAISGPDTPTGRERVIAVCTPRPSDWKSADTARANARLIAAAPELLEGLLHQLYRNHPYSENCDACLKSIKAVRKAEGDL